MIFARAGFLRSALTLVFGALMVAATPAAHASGSNDAALVMDAESGRVLYARSGDAPRSPASLTKIMTLFLLFDYMDQTGQTVAGTMTVSANAASQKPTKLGVKAGDTLTIGEATLALIIHSANDVSVAIAEHIAGSVPRFAEMMNAKARQLGMRRTNFANPSGLPDSRQVTTARDMAILARAMMRTHPNMYRYFSATSFTWRGKTTRTHNRVLTSLSGANGIKTGYTRLSGFNLTTSVERNGKRLIGVVMGGDSWKQRDDEMKVMLEAWFAQLNRRPQLVADYTGRAGATAAILAEAPAPAPAKEEPAPVAVAMAMIPEAKPIEVPAAAADDRRVIAMAPIPDQPAAAAPARTVAYYVPVPNAKPTRIASAEEPRRVAKVRTTDVAEGDTNAGEVVLPRAKPGADDQVVSLNALASNDPDDIAALIEAGYAKDETGEVRAAAPGKKSGDWGIQVGAFDSKSAANAEIERAQKTAKSKLKKAEGYVMSVKNDAGKTLYRARLAGLTSKEAESACAALKGEGFKCATFSNATASAN